MHQNYKILKICIFMIVNYQLHAGPCQSRILPSRPTRDVTPHTHASIATKLPIEIVQHICSFIPPDEHTGWTKLQDATGQNRLQDVITLIKLGFDINQVNKRHVANTRQNTPLYLNLDYNPKSRIEQIENRMIFHLLLQHGANQNKKNTHGLSSIYPAIWHGKKFAVQAFITSKADLDLANFILDMTPLDVAKYAAMNRKKTPLHRKKMYEICKLLQNAHAPSTIDLEPMPTDEQMIQQYKPKIRRNRQRTDN